MWEYHIPDCGYILPFTSVLHIRALSRALLFASGPAPLMAEHCVQCKITFVR